MSETDTLQALAIGFASGAYTEDGLLDILGTSTSVLEVIALSNEPFIQTIATEITRPQLIEDVMETATDIFDDIDLNPFNWD